MINPPLAEALDRLSDLFQLLTAVVATMSVDTARLEQIAEDSFSVISELADTLVREAGVSFRQAHSVASRISLECLEKNLRPRDVDDAMVARAFKEKIGREPTLSAGAVRKAFSPRHFVETRTVRGGTGGAPMRTML